MAQHEIWTSPLTGRYSSLEMQKLFSMQTRYSTWRKLWLYLAKSQKELGLDITDEALQQMEAHLRIEDDEWAVISAEEKRVRHDVMACVNAYKKVAPAAQKIHYGATSCYVTDNADLVIMRDGLDMLLPKLAGVIQQLRDFALQYKDLACLAYTHGQSAQPTTVGKRACQWIQDLLMDLQNIKNARDKLRFRGVKGTVGSQASFLAQFDGDHDKVDRLDELVTEKAGFKHKYIITTQTYTRKVDLEVVGALADFGCTCMHIGTDLRLLASFKEMEEPFEKDQIGSSAMAFKRNPMRSERLCSLGRALSGQVLNAQRTYETQWLERSLDDSANRRISLPESFLGADACLILLLNITAGLVVYPAIIKKRMDEELPFMATENIIDALVRKGKDRQEVHEQIRVLSHEAAAAVKLEGKPNDLIERMERTEFFEPILGQMATLTDPQTFVGRAPRLVEKFVEEEVDVALLPYAGSLDKASGGAVNV